MGRVLYTGSQGSSEDMIIELRLNDMELDMRRSGATLPGKRDQQMPRPLGEKR